MGNNHDYRPQLKEHIEAKIIVDNYDHAVNLFGKHDENLRFIEKQCPVKIVARGGELSISGEQDAVNRVEKLFRQLIALIEAGNLITVPDINYALKMTGEEEPQAVASALGEIMYTTPRGKQIKAKTLGQQRYIHAIRQNDVVFCIGPAGTGKTYLAVVSAVSALRNKEIGRIVLTRPAVEAGEKLGFLPGDLLEKVDPYLRPLYDALYDILGLDTAQKYMEKHIIEVAPLAYMRGRTLDDSFIILDEAQNTTPEQMKMFLTRLGFGSKAVITGDVTQVDLPRGQFSGLAVVQRILQGIDGISFQYLTGADVVRHPIVQKIIAAYDKHEDKSGSVEDL